jgi:DNA-binding transcriptional MerR regulator
MDAPIDNVSGAPDINSVQGASAVGMAGTQQLVQLMRVLVDEFASYASQDQVAQMLGSIQQLADVGVPVKDIADAMYASPGALDALRDGDTARAAQAMAGWMGENLHELRDSGVPDDRLRFLSEQGFGVGEITLAMRMVPGLREDLARGDFSNRQQLTQSMHEALSGNGRATHQNPALLTTERQPSALNPNAVWMEQYLRVIRKLKQRFAGHEIADRVRQDTLHPNDEDEMHLIVPAGAPAVEETSAHFGAWIVAVIIAMSVLVMLAQRC